MAHPSMLRTLVARYEELAALGADSVDPKVVRQREDTAYTLCVSTGTRDVRDALRVARQAVAAAGDPAAAPAAAVSGPVPAPAKAAAR
ncbi:DUF5133 domain-containing protein [Streptomyces sp. NPDC015131]|uniref:DUF5133 domain-containing protein n=1 Tax=Streptomyces sp. NPDC015131 TaxID=3364941 RepID=UPI00370068D7